MNWFQKVSLNKMSGKVLTSRASLAVQKDNYAVRMYKKVGFKIVKESEEEYLMICDLKSIDVVE